MEAGLSTEWRGAEGRKRDRRPLFLVRRELWPARRAPREAINQITSKKKTGANGGESD